MRITPIPATLSLTFALALAGCDTDADAEADLDGPVRIVDGYGFMLPPVSVGDRLLVTWANATDDSFGAWGARTDRIGAVDELGQLARVVDVLQAAWPVSVGDTAYVATVQGEVADIPYTVRVRPIGADGDPGGVNGQPMATAPLTFGAVDGALTLLRAQGGALFTQRFDGARWSDPTTLDATPCDCAYDLLDLGGHPLVIARAPDTLTVTAFDRETGAVRDRHALAAPGDGRRGPRRPLHAARVDGGLRIAWLDGASRPFQARALTLGDDGALLSGPDALLAVEGIDPWISLSPDGAWFAWSTAAGFTVAPFDTLDAPIAELPVSGEERKVWLVSIGGTLRALTGGLDWAGELAELSVDLWPLPGAGG